MWTSINQALNIIDNFVWGVPLMVLIIAGGLLLTIRLGLLQIRKLPLLCPLFHICHPPFHIPATFFLSGFLLSNRYTL